ncbi:hypothetical protein FJZ40_05065 [Candidatus Shapirobacteria bacterium]|nr:hypothetical protein [Candidatus Shapirobacteria bacterium]
MEEHPIPQQVSSYEFRLVGEMTLKQFGKLAVGVGLALLTYTLPLPFFVKWPLVALFALIGFALAFVPIKERPLEKWFASFLRAVYSPTEYTYRKENQVPEYLEEAVAQVAPVAPAHPKEAPSSQVGRLKVEEYLKTLPEETTSWENAENRFLDNISGLFEQGKPAGKPVSPLPKTPPAPKPPPLQAPTVTPKFTQAPLAPQEPNIISGTVLDQQGKLVESAILEIKDASAYPVRALRTNKLGQFRIATPLANGTYQIETEKEGLKFAIIKIEVKGEIIPPIEIGAK